MLAGIFVAGGIKALMRPKQHAEVASDVTDAVADATDLAASDETLVMINAGVQVAGGAALALGIVPRAAALALGATLVPTTLAAHRFWEESGDARDAQTVQFLKNASILGGLLFAALDTGGRPSVFWSGRRVAGDLVDSVASSTRSAVDAVTP